MKENNEIKVPKRVIVTERDQMLECMDALQEIMWYLTNKRDIWQNDAIYWICKGMFLLLKRATKKVS